MRIQEKLLEEMQNNHWSITFSIGVITCLTPPLSADEIVGQADQLMYEVKKSSKNAIKYTVLRNQNKKKKTLKLLQNNYRSDQSR